MATKPGQCDQATNDANAQIAKNRNPPRHYAPVFVKVLGATGADFKFSAVGTNEKWNTYGPVTWAKEENMWVSCPSSLPSSASDPNNPGLPPSGGEGNLYFTASFYNSFSIPIKHGA